MDIDANKFERVLTNLVRNALKFTDKGSVQLTLQAAGPWIVLVVEDTGIGIAADHLASIFERFRQADGSSTRRYEGTGIGLTLVKEYVELMLGKISVSSELGRGTRFQIDWPANLRDLVPEATLERRVTASDRGALRSVSSRRRGVMLRRQDDLARISVDDLAWMDQPGAEARNRDAVRGGGLKPVDRVLLAEDNVDLRTFIRTMLTKAGHDVLVAADGAEAWEMAEKDPPDLIVSDLMMPRMDGYELLRKVKTTAGTRQIPVILITAKPGLDGEAERV